MIDEYNTLFRCVPRIYIIKERQQRVELILTVGIHTVHTHPLAQSAVLVAEINGVWVGEIKEIRKHVCRRG